MQPANDLMEHCDRNRDEAKERLKEKGETGEMYMGRRRREGWRQVFVLLQLLDLDVVLSSPCLVVPESGAIAEYVSPTLPLLYIHHLHYLRRYVVACVCLIIITCSSSCVLVADLGQLEIKSDLRSYVPDVRVSIH